ncbi:MAG: carbohydrate ABC transporter substrate-binding protein [Oscillospiraceae bacterium]|nr:carbohydrate ABC transporter substrate-binding protein [Oscillospiraceae bacterium]
MKKITKATAGIMALTMCAALSACGGTSTSTPASTTAADTAATEAAPAEGGDTAETAAPAADGQVNLTISWWGGDSRHEATQKAVDAFMAKNPNIKVDVQFGAWSGWEDAMATSFYAGTAPDVNQINWNWIESYSADGSVFLDMNKVSDHFDLTQYSESALSTCTLAGELQAIPVSMTGRIFYWNKSTFDKAGISTPTSLEELYAAGQTFKDVLGDEYYPLAAGEYDRMILMVYFLESKYGKAWVENNTLNYTVDEIKDGLDFLQELEDKHVIPSIQTLAGDGADSLDKNPKWMNGTYAGIFEWDSSASKFGSALEEGQEFVVGDYFNDMGTSKGGFSKVSLAFAISENTPYPNESADLLNYLLNDDEGAAIMASERGIPLSANAFKVCTDQGLLNEKVSEANGKVLAWVSFGLDSKFEDAKLKNNPDGVYYDAIGGLSYKEYDSQEAAQILYDGITAVLNG